MRRVLVAGISGAGKTTMARHLSELLGVPRHELDALHHGAGWQKRPEFEADVARFASTDAWVAPYGSGWTWACCSGSVPTPSTGSTSEAR